jgi:hypothetical protein
MRPDSPSSIPPHMAGEPALMKTIFVGGLKRLPVRYELRA